MKPEKNKNKKISKPNVALPQSRQADDVVLDSNQKLSGFALISRAQVKLWKAMLVSVFFAGLVGALGFVAGFQQNKESDDVSLEIGYEASEAAVSSNSIEGTVLALHMDDIDHSNAQWSYGLYTDEGEFVDLSATKGLSPSLGGARVRIIGSSPGTATKSSVFSPHYVQPIGGAIEVIQRGQKAALPGTTWRVAVIVVNFQDVLAPKSFVAQSRETYFGTQEGSTNVFYRELSYGKLAQVTGAVYGPYILAQKLPQNKVECGSVWWNAVTLADPDIDYRNYDSAVVVMPRSPSCGYRGAATMYKTRLPYDGGAPIAEGIINDDSVGLHIAAHELGHNFGVEHASIWDCPGDPPGDPKGKGCVFTPHNPYDVMGYVKPGHMNAVFKKSLGWLNSHESQLVSESGSFSLAPLEKWDRASISAFPRALLIRHSFSQSHFYSVEYRLSEPSGVLVNWFWNTKDGVYLVYANSSPRQFLLSVGKTFFDPSVGVSITPQGIDNKGAMRVNVAFAESPELSVTRPVWRAVGADGDDILFEFTTRNTGTAAAHNFTDGLYVDNRLIGDLIPRDSLSAGQSIPSQVWWKKAYCGTHTVEVRTDTGNQVFELDETNNATRPHTITIDCGTRLPDFAIEDFTAPDKSVVGEPLTWSARLCNRGQASTPKPVSLSFIGQARWECESGAINPLHVDECSSVYSCTRSPTAPGQYYVGVYLKATDIEQSDTRNDFDNKWVEIVSGGQTRPSSSSGTENVSNPDYLIDTFAIVANKDGKYCAGERHTVNLRIKNNGRDTSASSRIRVFDQNNVVIWSLKDMKGLASGEHYPASKAQTFAWTPDSAGTHTITAMTDRDKVIAESNEENNIEELVVDVVACN